MTTDAEHAAVFREMLDRLTFEGESLPVKAAIERALELLESTLDYTIARRRIPKGEV